MTQFRLKLRRAEADKQEKSWEECNDSLGPPAKFGLSSGVDQRHLRKGFLPEDGIYIVSPVCCLDWLIISPLSSVSSQLFL